MGRSARPPPAETQHAKIAGSATTQAAANPAWLASETARLSREHSYGVTLYGWDGDQLAWEGDAETTTHYVFEPGSFVPLMLAKAKQRIALIPTPDWSERDYDIDADPLWTYNPEPQPFEQLYFYHTDHLGTPQELTDAEGNLAWSADYKAWGEAKAVISEAAQRAGISNPLRFQGQYFDHETGLHYNRHRYYDPSVGRFISKDPIKLLGGFNIYEYAPNPIEWIDPWGLAKKLSGNDKSGRPLSSSNYSVVAEAQMPPDLIVASDGQHFRESNKQLYNSMESNPEYKNMMEQQYPGISDHVAPGPRGGFTNAPYPGMTWHHHPTDCGKLQLMPQAQHKAPGPVQATLHPNQKVGKNNWSGKRKR